MKSLTWLAVRMCTDVHLQCATTPLRDIKTMKRRIEHEGDSFLTISLPAFDKGLTRALDLGRAAPDLFPGFHTRKGQSLPAFLQGLTELVFDIGTGHIHTNPSIEAIRGIRQFCLFLKKVKIICTPKRVSAAIRRFEECDAEIVASRTYGDRLRSLQSTSDAMASALFAHLDRWQEEFPRHGPGATAERVTGNSKYSVMSWWRNLALTHPVDEFLFTSCEHMLDDKWGISAVDCVHVQSPPVRVVTVPKTLSTPRVIAIEPVTMQYAQQQCSVSMTKAIESHCLTRGVINFTNQEINREKAITSSSSGVYATLDLSEASDRVSASLVSRCFRSVPSLRLRIFGSRSARASLPADVSHGPHGSGDISDYGDDLIGGGHGSKIPSCRREDSSCIPGSVRRSGVRSLRGGTPNENGELPRCDRSSQDPKPFLEGSGQPRVSNRAGRNGRRSPGRTVRLRKFASMGSALCFPVEAYMFYTIGMSAILESRNLRPTQRNLQSLKGLLYVYGDDIICHRDEVATVIEGLEYFGLKINAAKSFWTGKFRESCGMDAYDGECVTPTYLRSIQPRDRRSKSELVSWVATANLLYKAGYWGTASAMRKHVESILGQLPHVLETSSALGWTSFMGHQSVERWCKELQRFEVWGFVPSPLQEDDPLDDYPALLKCLLMKPAKGDIRNVLPTPIGVDEDHLNTTVRSRTVTLKREWVPAH